MSHTRKRQRICDGSVLFQLLSVAYIDAGSTDRSQDCLASAAKVEVAGAHTWFNQIEGRRARLG